jgi:hypothetical protein
MSAVVEVEQAMTLFLDGPAAGKTLMLTRAPHYLRAVQGVTGDWDALDQLTDTPHPGETVVAYEMVSGPRSMHVCSRGKKAVSGWFQGGDYRVVADQPTDEQLRSTDAWRAWVSARIGRPVAPDGSVAEAHR